MQRNAVIASAWMLVAGYIGEAFNPEGGSTSHSVTWGVLSTIGYVYVLYTIILFKQVISNRNLGVQIFSAGRAVSAI